MPRKHGQSELRQSQCPRTNSLLIFLKAKVLSSTWWPERQFAQPNINKQTYGRHDHLELVEHASSLATHDGYKSINPMFYSWRALELLRQTHNSLLNKSCQCVRPTKTRKSGAQPFAAQFNKELPILEVQMVTSQFALSCLDVHICHLVQLIIAYR